jgi:hypothetical protein
MSSQFEQGIINYCGLGCSATINIKVLEKDYLSKVKVKEAIEKFSGRSNNRWTDKAIQDFLKMELGLDGEQK